MRKNERGLFRFQSFDQTFHVVESRRIGIICKAMTFRDGIQRFLIHGQVFFLASGFFFFVHSHSSELMFLPRESGRKRVATTAGSASARQMPRMISKARGVA